MTQVDLGAPVDNLTRSVTFTLVRDDAASDGLTLEGYAAVFDTETVIDSWEGMFVERLERGAFKKTLRERTPVVQFDHGRHPYVGSIPIGAIDELSEDAKGLFIRARLHDNDLVKPVRDAISSGAIDGMSFRFSVVKEKWTDAKDTKSLPVRSIQEVKLYELGPVVFPAYDQTTVSIRGELIALAADPQFRAELARAMNLDTANEAVSEEQEEAVMDTSTDARDDTPDAAADDDTKPPEEGHLRVPTTKDARQQYVRRIMAARMGAGKASATDG